MTPGADETSDSNSNSGSTTRRTALKLTGSTLLATALAGCLDQSTRSQSEVETAYERESPETNGETTGTTQPQNQDIDIDVSQSQSQNQSQSQRQSQGNDDSDTDAPDSSSSPGDDTPDETDQELVIEHLGNADQNASYSVTFSANSLIEYGDGADGGVTDQINGRYVTGGVSGGSDNFYFAGEIENIEYGGCLRFVVDGETVEEGGECGDKDPSDGRSESSPNPDELPNRVSIFGYEASTFRLVFQGEAWIYDPDVEAYVGSDYVSSSVYDGETSIYLYSGELVNINYVGNIEAEVNGSVVVQPDQGSTSTSASSSESTSTERSTQQSTSEQPSETSESTTSTTEAPETTTNSTTETTTEAPTNAPTETTTEAETETATATETPEETTTAVPETETEEPDTETEAPETETEAGEDTPTEQPEETDELDDESESESEDEDTPTVVPDDAESLLRTLLGH